MNSDLDGRLRHAQLQGGFGDRPPFHFHQDDCEAMPVRQRGEQLQQIAVGCPSDKAMSSVSSSIGTSAARLGK